eukprot:4126212-Alexandrium_andersonii.AAC.1
MSASLVGSEMCIRDRSWTDPRARPRPHRTAEGRPERGPRGAARERGQRPVSYTHLTLPTICSV